MGSPPVLHHTIQLAGLDIGLAQNQYELKPFKWTTQSTDQKWRKFRLETYKYLFCTVLATVLYHMASKLPWDNLFLRKSWCSVARYHQKKLFSRHCFSLNIAEIDSITSHLQLFFVTNDFHDKSLFNKKQCKYLL